MDTTLVDDTRVETVDPPSDTSSNRPRRGRAGAAKAIGAVFAVLIASGALIGFANPASASPDAEAEPAGVAAPPCVWTYLDDTGGEDYLEVHNDCSYDVRVQVVLAWQDDFPCITIRSGTYHQYWWYYPGRFDGLRDC
jgi:hypothetical protein